MSDNQHPKDEDMVIQSQSGEASPHSDPPPPVDVGDNLISAEEEQDDDLKPRLERLGGEPAPDITPEEFARLQQSGQIHIDPRGRVRSTRVEEEDAGVSLRKRRAWYT